MDSGASDRMLQMAVPQNATEGGASDTMLQMVDVCVSIKWLQMVGFNVSDRMLQMADGSVSLQGCRWDQMITPSNRKIT